MKESYESTAKAQNFIKTIIDGVKGCFQDDLQKVEATGIPEILGKDALEVLFFKNGTELYHAVANKILKLGKFTFSALKKIPEVTKYINKYNPRGDGEIVFSIESPELNGEKISISFGYPNNAPGGKNINALYNKEDGIFVPLWRNVPPALTIHEIIYNNPQCLAHELTHCYQDKLQTLPDPSEDYQSYTNQEYHNNASETNAFFHETIAFLERYLGEILNNLESSEDIDWFIKKIIKTPNGIMYYLPDFDPAWNDIYEWYSDLNDKNKKKFIKKLAEYLYNKHVNK